MAVTAKLLVFISRELTYIYRQSVGVWSVWSSVTFDTNGSKYHDVIIEKVIEKLWIVCMVESIKHPVYTFTQRGCATPAGTRRREVMILYFLSSTKPCFT